MTKPKDCLVDCRQLGALDEECQGSAAALLARLYHDAFQIAITHSDQARASVSASKAHHSRVIYKGEGSPDTKHI